MDPLPHPCEVSDADGLLKDWGKSLVCAAAPLVTRGLVDLDIVERAAGERTVLVQQVVLKVKIGAFDGIAVRNTRVDVTDEYGRTLSYTIDQQLPRGIALFDYYALQPYRT